MQRTIPMVLAAFLAAGAATMNVSSANATTMRAPLPALSGADSHIQEVRKDRRWRHRHRGHRFREFRHDRRWGHHRRHRNFSHRRHRNRHFGPPAVFYFGQPFFAPYGFYGDFPRRRHHRHYRRYRFD